MVYPRKYCDKLSLIIVVYLFFIGAEGLHRSSIIYNFVQTNK